MGRLGSAFGAGCVLSLLTLPLSIWAEVPAEFFLLGGFAAGFLLGWLHQSALEQERARDEMHWRLVGLRTAEKCGWDLRVYVEDQSFWPCEKTHPRYWVAEKAYELARKYADTAGGAVARIRGKFRS